MKKLVLSSLLLLIFASCTTGTKMQKVEGIENLNREAYTIKEEATSISRTNKFWILFFPFGGKSEEKREAQCFKRFMEDNKADGIIAGKYIHKKITVPLIVFTYSYKWTTLKGKPFIIKTDK